MATVLGSCKNGLVANAMVVGEALVSPSFKIDVVDVPSPPLYIANKLSVFTQSGASNKGGKASDWSVVTGSGQLRWCRPRHRYPDCRY